MVVWGEFVEEYYNGNKGFLGVYYMEDWFRVKDEFLVKQMVWR